MHAKEEQDWNWIMETFREFLSEFDPPAVSEEARQRNPFHVLVATVLSLRTKDEVTAQAARRLLSRADSPDSLAGMNVRTIERLIYPAGFYRNKARSLKEISRILIKQHGGEVPKEMDQLLALPGVGRKTANLVRNLGFGLPGICVDTHVHRISNRMGWVSTRNPHETEAALELILPEKYWIPINGTLVSFGKRICTPLSPWCSRCPVSQICARKGVERSR
jgi:endonuclease-3